MLLRCFKLVSFTNSLLIDHPFAHVSLAANLLPTGAELCFSLQDSSVYVVFFTLNKMAKYLWVSVLLLGECVACTGCCVRFHSAVPPDIHT